MEIVPQWGAEQRTLWKERRADTILVSLYGEGGGVGGEGVGGGRKGVVKLGRWWSRREGRVRGGNLMVS